MTKWLEKTVQTQVQGYASRAEDLRFGIAKGAVETEYRRINNAIDDALRELFDSAELQRIMRHDIATGTGYRKTDARGMFGRGSYERSKEKAIRAIARRLNLIA